MQTPFIDQPIIILDCEFTGVDVKKHELIEVAALRINQRTMEIVGEFETRITPTRIEDADAISLRVAGYDPQLWEGALSLTDALRNLVTFVGEEHPTFAGWNIALDWAFLASAFRETEVENPFDYFSFDILTLASEHFKNEANLERRSLAHVTRYVGLQPERYPHRAMNGAKAAYDIFKFIRNA